MKDLKKKQDTVDDPAINRGLREGALIGLVALGLYLLLALASYNRLDPGWSYTGESMNVRNLVGPSGAWLADVCFYIFGYWAYLFPALLLYSVYLLFRDKSLLENLNRYWLGIKGGGLFIVLLSGTALTTLHDSSGQTDLPASAGGILGTFICDLLVPSFHYLGTVLFQLALFLYGLTWFVNISWFRLMEKMGELTMAACVYTRDKFENWQQQRAEKSQVEAVKESRKDALEQYMKVEKKRKPPTIAAPVKKPEPSSRIQKERQGKLFEATTDGELPEIGLLDEVQQNDKKGYSKEALEAMSRLLEIKLKDFGIDIEVVAVNPGPVITRFEVQPAPGIKVSRISNLVKDLARSLAVVSVRVVEVIPGKTCIGIEIPNEDREIIRLSEILSSTEFDKALSPLSIALGHDISGQSAVVDIAKMPHLLVAGTTGSGKSVGINAMILSLLFKSSPDDVRLIMIDPKMLELSVYEGIPHLLTPVITDMKDAANGLRWCVAEMERRYKLMSAMGVRNVTGFNRKVLEAEKAGQAITDPLWQPDQSLSLDDQQAPTLEKFPYIVVIVDELADMMMVVGKKVEELIARIAQKARAAGIHLILATQRPSVDVLTGLIKANIPTRLSFMVQSKVDSRTILGEGGGEQLLGHGDMLYLPPGGNVAVRVHGAFVGDDEVHRVVSNWKKRGTPVYIDAITSTSDGAELSLDGSANENGNAEEFDALYDEAVQFVTETRKASISSVQRKLRIGYNRAARMIESMEMAGVVSAMNTNGSREVLAPPPVKE